MHDILGEAHQRVRITTRPAAETTPTRSASSGLLRRGPSLMKGPVKRSPWAKPTSFPLSRGETAVLYAGSLDRNPDTSGEDVTGVSSIPMNGSPLIGCTTCIRQIIRHHCFGFWLPSRDYRACMTRIKTLALWVESPDIVACTKVLGSRSLYAWEGLSYYGICAMSPHAWQWDTEQLPHLLHFKSKFDILKVTICTWCWFKDTVFVRLLRTTECRGSLLKVKSLR